MPPSDSKTPSIWALALVNLSGTLAMHIFVPAMPSAALELGATTAAIQFTISVYILGLAGGQLIHGPLSDRFGRRPILMAGLAVYTLAGLGAALATTATTLVWLRLFQAIGGCAGLVISRAVIRDTTAANEAARRLALMNLITVAGPMVAPTVGSLVTVSLGWRAIFFGLVALGVLNFWMAWRVLPLPRSAAATSVGVLARNYARLVRSPLFLGYTIGGACATTSIYGFISAAPFIFTHQLGRSTYETGLYLGVLLIGAWVGSVLANRLIGRFPLKILMHASTAVAVAGGLVFLGAAVTHTIDVVIAVGSMFVVAAACGMASPMALTQAMGVNAQMIGSASGLYGFTQMAYGALCAWLVSFGDDPALAAGLVQAGSAIVAQLCFWLALRRA